MDRHLFNGAWYHQQIDVRDRSILERFLPSDPDIIETYWNDEAGEIKYQIAEGSEIDQLNAQWHANLCGLGDLFDPGQRRTALRSLYRNNFKSTMRDFFNACRIYCMNDEGGLVISDWPAGAYRPVVPLPYAGETQNGYEYQAAILMIQEGLIDEGLTAVGGDPRPLRRRPAQPLERVRVRLQLRPLDGGLVARPRLQRLRVRHGARHARFAHQSASTPSGRRTTTAPSGPWTAAGAPSP